jgi:hypothetical protein
MKARHGEHSIKMVRICDYKNKAEDDKQIHYASIIQKLQRELRLYVSSFLDSGVMELSSVGISSSLPSLTSTDKEQLLVSLPILKVEGFRRMTTRSKCHKGYPRSSLMRTITVSLMIYLLVHQVSLKYPIMML